MRDIFSCVFFNSDIQTSTGLANIWRIAIFTVDFVYNISIITDFGFIFS